MRRFVEVHFGWQVINVSVVLVGSTVVATSTAVAGTIVGVNAELNGSPDLVNREPYTGAWMIRIKLDNSAAAQALLTADQYKQLL